MDELFPARLDRLRAETLRRGASGALVTTLPDARWLTGFTGSNALVAVLDDRAWLLTDGRYAEQAGRETSGLAVEIVTGALALRLPALLPHAPLVLLRQSDGLALDAARQMAEALPRAVWMDAPGLLTPFRAVKSEGEIAAIANAQAITDRVFEEICGLVAPGMTEKEVAAEVVYRHLRRGAEKMAFEPIVASGPNSALPHARPTARRLERGDVLVLDMGCVVDGYASDMTRTVVLGEPRDAHVRQVYETVLAAQQAALAAARAGISGAALDAFARDIIAEAGYGSFFSHSLGHGLGLETHEWPRLAAQTPDALPAGCVVTIEPGIYLPGRFGVRIEDLVVLGEEGCRNLTGAPKTWRVIA